MILYMFLIIFISEGSAKINEYEKCLKNSKVDLFNNGDIYLEVLISPLINNISNSANEVRIIWNNKLYDAKDEIVLYANLSKVFSSPVFTKSGQFDTGIFLDQNSIFSAVYARENITVAKSYFKKYPTWMNDLKVYLEDLYLSQAFIPGTHLSAAYYTDDKRQAGIYKYILSQDEEIIDQLISGVRYLDLRVGRYNSTDEKWWCNHDFLPMRPLKTILDQIKTFLNQTNEIVILDFHRFPVGFDEEAHKELVRFLKEDLKDFTFEGSASCTLKFKDVWNSKKRLLISYNEDAEIDGFISPPIAQKWGNKQTLVSLYGYLNDILDNFSYRLRCSACMAELTPTAIIVFFNQLGGLRQMANTVNTNLSIAFHNEWSQNANIVAVDFVKSSGVVTAAMRSNVVKYCSRFQ